MRALQSTSTLVHLARRECICKMQINKKNQFKIRSGNTTFGPRPSFSFYMQAKYLKMTFSTFYFIAMFLKPYSFKIKRSKAFLLFRFLKFADHTHPDFLP